MMKTEYTESGGFLQRVGAEHEEYAVVYSTERQEVAERDGADLLEKVLDRDNLNRAYKRVKVNIGASGIDGMTVDEVPGYYGVAEMKNDMELWNEWLRRRIRMYIWKRWKLLRTMVESLKKLGMPEWQAYRNGNARKGYWCVAGSGILSHTIQTKGLHAMDVMIYPKRASFCTICGRTVVYRAVRTAV